jgi:hypothetical protein
MKKQVEIIVPESWSDVTLKRYQKYHRKIADLKDEDEIILTSVSALCNIPIDIIRRLKVSDIKVLYTKLSKLISIPVNKEMFDKIEIKGVKYGFHPNLDELTLGEFVDLEEQTKDGIDGFHNVLAILYRPITEEKGNKYNIEPYNESHIKNALLFQELSIDVVNGVMLFFYRLGNKFIKNSNRYLEQNLPKYLQEVSTDGLVS